MSMHVMYVLLTFVVVVVWVTLFGGHFAGSLCLGDTGWVVDTENGLIVVGSWWHNRKLEWLQWLFDNSSMCWHHVYAHHVGVVDVYGSVGHSVLGALAGLFKGYRMARWLLVAVVAKHQLQKLVGGALEDSFSHGVCMSKEVCMWQAADKCWGCCGFVAVLLMLWEDACCNMQQTLALTPLCGVLCGVGMCLYRLAFPSFTHTTCPVGSSRSGTEHEHGVFSRFVHHCSYSWQTWVTLWVTLPNRHCTLPSTLRRCFGHSRFRLWDRPLPAIG